MTLSSTISKQTYAGDGATTSFPIPFLFLDNAHIEAVLRDSLGNETVWSENTHYTLAGAGAQAGGTLSVLTSPADHTPQAGETLVIRRIVPATQETDYPEGGAFPAAAHETALDKLTMLAQQHDEQLARALRFRVSDPAALSGEIPGAEARANRFLAFDEAGAPIAAAGQVGGVPVSPFLATLLDDASAAAARGTLGISLTGVDIYAADFGAAGDGVTDDTSALQAAIAACTAGQRLRLTPDRTYITTGIALDRAGMVLDLNGATIRLKDAAASNAKAVAIAADDVWIVGPGTIDGNRANQTAGNTGPVWFDDVDRVRIAGVHVRSSEVYGIHANDTVDSLFLDCRITDCADYGIKVFATDRDVTGVVAARCRVDQTATLGGCISFAENAAVSIDRCAIVDCRCAAAEAAAVDVIHFFGSGTLNQVRGCHVEGGDIGISIANSQSHALVSGCTVHNADAIGIEIADSTHCAVVGNVVDGDGNTPRGVSVDGANTAADGTTVVGNTIRRCTDSGIYFYIAAPGSVASANTIHMASPLSAGIYLNLTSDIALECNTIEGNGTAGYGVAIIRASRIALTGNKFANLTNQAIEGAQSAAGSMDNIAIVGGSMHNTSYVQFTASGGGTLGNDITLHGVAGYLAATGVRADVLDFASFRIRGWGTASPEGLVTAGVGSIYHRLGGAVGAQLYIKESGTGNTGWRALQSRTIVEVTVGQAELAAGASKTLVAAIGDARFKLRNILLSGAGTNFSGGGGDRNIAIQDSSGTTIWSVLTAAKIQSLAATRWGDSGMPFPATAAHLTAQSIAGEALVAKYSGGTADYTAGSLTLILEYERTT